jgi:hypothetical protein
MTELQKQILEVILKSQLMIEKVRLNAIENNIHIFKDSDNGDFDICIEVIEEIKRQLSVLSDTRRQAGVINGLM